MSESWNEEMLKKMGNIDPALIEQLRTLALARKPSDRPYFVLHVDDEVMLHEVFSEIVPLFGCKLHAVPNAKEALSFIREHVNDIVLIISDMRMPEMDGFMLRNEVLTVSPAIPFAILSAYVDRELALRGMEYKISAFLGKPVDYSSIASLFLKDVAQRIKSLREDEELRDGFVSETSDLIEQAEELAMRLDGDPNDVETLNLLFGIVHTIKGVSSFFEPKTLHQFAHRYEDILKRLQRGELKMSGRILSTILRGIDQIKALLDEFKSLSFANHDIDEMFKALESEAESVEEEADSGRESENPSSNGKPLAKENEIRVSVALLDEFMQMSGEMTVIRNMLNKCVRSIERQYSGDKDVAMLVELLEELHKVNGSVQAKLTELRQIPVKSVTRRLPRAVRDVSASLKKEALLEISGEDLRVDTAIAEVLSNSLLHLVKNSLDHGLESPEKRVSVGKPATGKIAVHASVKNNRVEVEIRDDGNGINPTIIGDKLIQNGTHTREQVSAMSRKELYEMIFSAGFSTAKQVTDISGRGVGMSMVKTSVESIGGVIEIESELGKGSNFKLKLPIPKSVHITNCLFMRVGTECFGIPEDEVYRVLQLEGCDKLRQVSGGTVIEIDGELVSVVSLSKVFACEGGSTSESSHVMRSLIIAQCDQSFKKIALQVDEVLDVEDTVIKSVPSQVNPQGIYRGATFLNDGRIGLVISTAGIVEHVGFAQSARPVASQASLTESAIQAVERKMLLLFESVDSEVYAIEQNAIFRIEQMKLSSSGRASGSYVVPYREAPLQIKEWRPCANAAGQLSGKMSGTNDASATVLIVEHQGKRMGIRVSQVLDIFAADSVQTDLADPQTGILGHAFWDTRIITVIDHHFMWSLGEKAKAA